MGVVERTAAYALCCNDVVSLNRSEEPQQQLEEAVEAEMTKLHTTLAQQLDDSAQYVCSRLVEWVGLL